MPRRTARAGYQLTMNDDRDENEERPACIAETVSIVYPPEMLFAPLCHSGRPKVEPNQSKRRGFYDPLGSGSRCARPNDSSV